MAQACLLCGADTHRILAERPDYEYGVPTQLDYHRCGACRLVFASPVPSELLSSFYVSYHTHAGAQARPKRRLWDLLQRVSAKPDHALSFPTLQTPKSARILDFGCGSGHVLKARQAEGYANLAGYDFDPQAAAASLPGVRIFESVEAMRGEVFDLITMYHVIEHLEDPSATVAELLGLLSESGRLYIRTPNADSLLAGVMGPAWRGWETPRHLFVFTPDTLRTVIERGGGEVVGLTTSNDLYPTMLSGSLNNRLGHRMGRLVGAAAYAPLSWISQAVRGAGGGRGEEIVAVVGKPQA